MIGLHNVIQLYVLATKLLQRHLPLSWISKKGCINTSEMHIFGNSQKGDGATPAQAAVYFISENQTQKIKPTKPLGEVRLLRPRQHLLHIHTKHHHAQWLYFFFAIKRDAYLQLEALGRFIVIYFAKMHGVSRFGKCLGKFFSITLPVVRGHIANGDI